MKVLKTYMKDGVKGAVYLVEASGKLRVVVDVGAVSTLITRGDNPSPEENPSFTVVAANVGPTLVIRGDKPVFEDNLTFYYSFTLNTHPHLKELAERAFNDMLLLQKLS